MRKINILKLFANLVLAAILIGGVGLGIFYQIATSGTAATGTLTFTGNVTNGETVTITDPSISATYTFEFNTSAGSAVVCTTTNCIPVNLSENNGVRYNDSWRASGNLTAAINSNTSTSDLVTAANTTNVTRLTAKVLGTEANRIGTTENVANAHWGSSTLTGGANTWDVTTILIWGFIAVVVVAGLILKFLEQIGLKIKL